MVARIRYRKRAIARVALLTLAAAAFVFVSGLPAQAQGLYVDFSLFPPAPAYQTDCQQFAYGGLIYTSCSTPSYVYYSPYVGPTYVAPTPVVYYESPYYESPYYVYNGP
jgi:hypothetical protein